MRKYESGTGSNRQQNVIVPDWRHKGETLNVPPQV